MTTIPNPQAGHSAAGEERQTGRLQEDDTAAGRCVAAAQCCVTLPCCLSRAQLMHGRRSCCGRGGAEWKAGRGGWREAEATAGETSETDWQTDCTASRPQQEKLHSGLCCACVTPTLLYCATTSVSLSQSPLSQSLPLTFLSSSPAPLPICRQLRSSAGLATGASSLNLVTGGTPRPLCCSLAPSCLHARCTLRLLLHGVRARRA